MDAIDLSEFFQRIEKEAIPLESLIGALLALCLIALLCAFLAKRKGRSPILWALMGLFFNFFGFVALLCLGESEEFLMQKSEAWKKRRQRFSEGFIQDLAAMQEDYVEIQGEAKPPASEESYLWYFVDDAGEKQGPLRFAKLIDLWKEGIVKEVNYIWNDSLDSWKCISELEGLKEKLDQG